MYLKGCSAVGGWQAGWKVILHHPSPLPPSVPVYVPLMGSWQRERAPPPHYTTPSSTHIPLAPCSATTSGMDLTEKQREGWSEGRDEEKGEEREGTCCLMKRGEEVKVISPSL